MLIITFVHQLFNPKNSWPIWAVLMTLMPPLAVESQSPQQIRLYQIQRECCLYFLSVYLTLQTGPVKVSQAVDRPRSTIQNRGTGTRSSWMSPVIILNWSRIQSTVRPSSPSMISSTCHRRQVARSDAFPTSPRNCTSRFWCSKRFAWLPRASPHPMSKFGLIANQWVLVEIMKI